MSYKRVWGVRSGSYSDYRVLCICDSKKRAEAVAEQIRGEEGSWNRDAEVEGFLYVDSPMEKKSFLHMTVTIWDDGITTHVGQSVEEEYEVGSLNEHIPMSWRWVRAPMHRGRGGRLDVKGIDHELVRKVYGERRAQLLADPAFRAKGEAKGRVTK